MALREEFEKSGNWLFRWRSYLPLLLAPLLVAALFESAYSDGTVWNIPADYFRALAILISILGFLVRCITAGYVPRGTSGRNVACQEAQCLNTSGMYSMVRHPLYLGNSLMIFGITLFVGTWWLPLFTILLLWLYYERIMFAEEEFLRRKFGESYVEWASRTPAFLPAFPQWKTPDLRFSLVTVLRREFSGYFGMASTFSFLGMIDDIIPSGECKIDSVWLAIFGISLAFYLIMVFLKKKTGVLQADGR